jgi:hypothetical protein
MPSQSWLEDQPVENGSDEYESTKPDEDHPDLVSKTCHLLFCQLLLHLGDRHQYAKEEDDYR